ncbi:hypothetical protein [Halococcus thailandensis]|uniref:Uncharacterized protein n=1 Tax=Halococcus thailandensis JCM 13552 TaxID=1227457 RepID=M0N7C7_9EURY|nr:hypothetical protein [Halococcus thailandensis]EMA53852.1 hypothetical protein C451_08735 [Halococcus thailandensis JCM 13552]
MERRELLRELLLAGGTVTVAGCIGGDGGENGSSPTGTETSRAENGEPTAAGPEPTTAGPAPTRGSATDEPATSEPTTESGERTPTGAGTPNATEGEESTTDSPSVDVPGGGDGTSTGGSARVTSEGDGSRIVVEGTIVGRNGCQSAVLDSVRQEGSELIVTIATENEAGTGRVCSMALTELDYRFVVRRDSPPDSVTVVHRGASGERTVTTATP